MTDNSGSRFGLSVVNRALNRIPRRAEQNHADQLRETFLDSGVAAALDTVDHQVVFGRRGTGKTHALRYLESEVRERGDLAVYVDLRTVGSPQGLFVGEELSDAERAARLLVDTLSFVHDELLSNVIEDEYLMSDSNLINRLDQFADSISSLRVDGSVEISDSTSNRNSNTNGFGLSGTLSVAPSAQISGKTESTVEKSDEHKEVHIGSVRTSLNFRQISLSLRNLNSALYGKRLWLLLDEWISVPARLQPMLGEFLVRCVTPNPEFTVKIGAIEQQSNFRESVEGGIIGIELGADFSATVNLDEFMVFEQDSERSIQFFKGLLYKHLINYEDSHGRIPDLNTEDDLVRAGFSEKRSFEELVRAAEGVPRDAINVASKAALKAREKRITMAQVRDAARAWYQSDKEAAIKGIPEAQEFLNWIIDEVIREKKSRGFLVNQNDSNYPALLGLFDARVLHLTKRGYSAQDTPGERYDVWTIDYGAYVDLMRTKNEPQELNLFELDMPMETNDEEVPMQDLRAIRRAVLNLSDFNSRNEFR